MNILQTHIVQEKRYFVTSIFHFDYIEVLHDADVLKISVSEILIELARKLVDFNVVA